MKAVVGLGNPGRQYELTRHNAGFVVVDNLAEECGASFGGTRFKGVAARTSHRGENILLAKPATYMNLSGHFVSSLLNYYKISMAECLVVHDDLDLPMGRFRLARGGGSAGHKGIKSIIEQLGGQEFPRLKVGVGRPNEFGDVVDYVLSRFSESELETLSGIVDHCLDAIADWAELGVDAAMNRNNFVSLERTDQKGGG